MRKWILVLFAAALLAEPVHAKELTAVGQAVGIRLQEDGVTITGFTESGNAERTGLRVGDRIVAVGGTAVSSAAEISNLTSAGEPVAVAVDRDGKRAEFLVTPVQAQGKWLLGVKIRDSVCGIGTVTFYDRDSGLYGALGHGVKSEDGDLLTITGGELIGASVTGCKTGRRGVAGQLLGDFDRTAKLGNVGKNTSCGIFGRLTAAMSGVDCPLADPAEVHPGEAVILSNVTGTEVREYAVQIRKICPGDPERNLLLEITDEDLLRQTGGIVQGMSGSPIIQDGKLVGAVTHVLINQPDTGYGIFIENMLDAAS